MKHKVKQIFLLLGDVAILYLALYLTLFLRKLRLPDMDFWNRHFEPFTIVFGVWLIIFYIADLYNLHRATNNNKFFTLSLKTIGVASLFSAAYFYANPNLPIAPKTNLVIYLFVFAALFLAWRHFFNWFLYSRLPKDNIMVIGYNEQVKELISTLEEKPHLGHRIRIIVDPKRNDIIDAPGSIELINDITNLKDPVKKNKISTIVLVSDPHRSDDLRAALFDCLSLKVNMISLVNFYEGITGKIPLSAINQMWFLENLQEGRRGFFDVYKKIFDITLALAILLLTLPLWPFIIIGIKLSSPGPAFYLSRRMGQHNREFNLVKFRTMREEGNTRTITTANDGRVTRLGQYLRVTRVDEIPQVLNVLRGEMSFIGPRPERPELIEDLQKHIPFYKERMLAKPGLTGWAQVAEYHSPTIEDTIKKLQYDLFYIKNRSIYLDLSITLKTIAMVVKRGGR